MLRLLRDELQALMAGLSVQRRPAVRRSDEPDWLLATDLPLVASVEELARFAERAAAQGWRIGTAKGWLLLDHVPVTWPVDAALTGEAACVLRLLRLHPGGGDDPLAARMLMKAAEQGAPAVEKACAGLHRCYAALLRDHECLPDGLIPVLMCACTERSIP